MIATESQPNILTKAIACWGSGSMATPEGSGAVQAVVLRSTLCSTVKSSALVTLPLPSSTSSANRRAERSRLDITVAVSWRSPLPEQWVSCPTPSRRTLRFVDPFTQVSPLPMTVSVGEEGFEKQLTDEVVRHTL